ncbi:hypothetical protein ACFL2T_05755 [Elusimicrobiota bacterium]
MRHAFFAVFATSILWAALPGPGRAAPAEPATKPNLSEQQMRHQVSQSLADLRKTVSQLNESAKVANYVTLQKMAGALKDADAELKKLTDPHGLYQATQDLNMTLGLLQRNLRTMKAGQAKKIVEGVGVIAGKLLPLVNPEVIRAQERQRAEGFVKGRLGDIRQALVRYRRDNDGYPRKPKALTKGGKYMTSIPYATLSQHERTRSVRVLKKVADQADLTSRLEDSGKWLYVGDEESPLFGTLIIDCTHKDSRGMPWSGY